MKENIPGLILKMLEVITLHNPLSLCVPPYICTLKINEKTRTIREDGGLNVWTVEVGVETLLSGTKR